MKKACMSLPHSAPPRFLRWLTRSVRTGIALGLALLCSGSIAETAINYQPDAIPRAQLVREKKDGQAPPTLAEYFLAIYSGSTTGVYFEVASKICELMRQTYEQHHIRCVPLRSTGTGDNVRLIQKGRAQVAIVQSDTNWEAADDPRIMPNARSVMSLHNEMGLLVVRADSGIRSVADLRGKRINIGPEGSAARRLWLDLLAAHNMDLTSLRKVYGAVHDFNQNGLCLNYIDAYGIWIGHPAKLIRDTLNACNAKVIGMYDPATEAMLAKSPFLFKQTLPVDVYPGQTTAIESYGLKATLIAAEQANPYVIYWLARIVHENNATLRGMHPALFSLKPDELRDKGNFLPFHDGAACYWLADDTACAWKKNFPAFREAAQINPYRKTDRPAQP
jgi:TRAP transporter TAXI family solute receptor